MVPCSRLVGEALSGRVTNRENKCVRTRVDARGTLNMQYGSVQGQCGPCTLTKIHLQVFQAIRDKKREIHYSLLTFFLLMLKVLLTSKGHKTRPCFSPPPFFCWFSLHGFYPRGALRSTRPQSFLSSRFPCAFRPTGNDRTRRLRPAVTFNQLSVFNFRIDSRG